MTRGEQVIVPDDWAKQHGVDLNHDMWSLQPQNWWMGNVKTATLVVDELGRVEQPVQGMGVNYLFSRIDYQINGQAAASRRIATIPPGGRTALAYWRPEAPKKHLTVHSGKGVLFYAPSFADDHLYHHSLTADGVNEVTLEPDTFYALMTSSSQEEPLVVSGFYKQPIGNWRALETEFLRGDHIATTGKGDVRVPATFWNYFKDK